MPKIEIDSWSLLEVEMNASLKSFNVLRTLKRSDLGKPGLKPTFIFLTSDKAHIFVNDSGTFLLRFKKPKALRGAKKDTFKLSPVMFTPKLYKLKSKSPLGRLAKKAMKQLFMSGKITEE
jgi:hypothetical protein